MSCRATAVARLSSVILLLTLLQSSSRAQTPPESTKGSTFLRQGFRENADLEGSPEERHNEYIKKGCHYLLSGRFQEAETQFAAAISFYSLKDYDQSSYFCDLMNYAYSIDCQNRSSEADLMISKALAKPLNLRSLLPEHFDSIFDLATRIYRHQGKIGELRRFYEWLLPAEYHGVLDDNYNSFNNHVLQLIRILIELEDFAEAEKWQEAELNWVEMNVPCSSSRWDESLCSLVRIYSEQRKFEEAEATIKTMMLLRESSLGKRHPKVADTTEVYARLLHEMNRNEESNLSLFRVLSIRLECSLANLVRISGLALEIPCIQKMKP